MTDLEILEALLNKAGIIYSIETDSNRVIGYEEGDFQGRKTVKTIDKCFAYIVKVERNKQSEYVFGYPGFYSEWFFDEDKNLVTVGHWE